MAHDSEYQTEVRRSMRTDSYLAYCQRWPKVATLWGLAVMAFWRPTYPWHCQVMCTVLSNTNLISISSSTRVAITLCLRLQKAEICLTRIKITSRWLRKCCCDTVHGHKYNFIRQLITYKSSSQQNMDPARRIASLHTLTCKINLRLSDTWAQ
jgi:hypothetical protein